MTVVGLLPLISLLFTCLSILKWRSASGDPDAGLYALLSGTTVWVALLVAVTETLSFFERLTFPPLLAFWTAAAVASAALYGAARRKYPPGPRPARPPYSAGQALLLAAILAITATIGCIAFIAPPNTWDSMDYHMPRVLFWIQNRTVDFYPTYLYLQNQMGPGASYIVMHLQILSGSDALANFVQWYAFIGCMAGSVFLCRRFGLGRTAALCAALFVATIPMGILEASSTYVDYVTAFWVMSFACFTSRTEEPGRSDALSRLLPGLTLGLALLTKATAYLYAAPFLISFVVLQVRRRRLAAAAPLAVCAAITLLVNAGHYARCYDLRGDPLGITVNVLDRDKNITDKLSNDTFGPKAILSNLIRNTATHFIMTPSVSVNLAAEAAAVRLHELLNIDANDRRTTWTRLTFPGNANKAVLKNAGERRRFRSDEGISNPLHFLMIVLGVGMILGRKNLRRREGLLLYALCCVAGFFLFCGYLKWQEWHSRLHLPFFVLSAPFVAAALFDVKASSPWRKAGTDETVPNGQPAISKIRSRTVDSSVCPRFLARAVSRIGMFGRAMSMIVLTLMTVPLLLYHCERPLLGEHSMLPKTRDERYFWFPQRKEPFMNARQFLKDRDVRNIGFVGFDWEYPMMVLLKEDHPQARFLSVNVRDHSRVKYELARFRDFRPDAIITLRRADRNKAEPEIVHQGRVFQLQSKVGHIGVYLPAPERK